MMGHISMVVSMIIACLFLYSCNECRSKVNRPKSQYNTYRKAFDQVAAEHFDFRFQYDIEQNTCNIYDAPYIDETLLFVPLADQSKIKNNQQSYLRKSIDRIQSIIEKKRKEHVRDAFNREITIHSTYDLAVLTPPNRKAVRKLIDIGYWINDLYKLQNHPKSITLEKELIRNGDMDSLKYFQRIAGPRSPVYGDKVYANAAASLIDSKFAAIMWPENMNARVFKQIDQMSVAKRAPFLSPLTAVQVNSEGQLIAIPYANHEPFQPYLKKIAERLRDTALISGLKPQFKQLLHDYAKSCESTDVYPYAMSDASWVKSADQLELIMGAFETNRDPHQVKAFYEFVIGASDPKGMRFITHVKRNMAYIESLIQTQVAPCCYVKRDINSVPNIRLIDVILATGITAHDDGVPLAIRLPNIGPIAKQEKHKTVIFKNHYKAKTKILKQISKQMLSNSHYLMLTEQSFLDYSIVQMIMLLLGPQSHNTVMDSSQSISQALGSHFQTIKNIKNQTGASWAAAILMNKRLLTKNQLDSIYVAYVGNILRYLRFGQHTDIGRAAGIQFAFLLDQGALVKLEHGFDINMNMLKPAIDSLFAKSIQILSKADVKSFKIFENRLFSEYRDEILYVNVKLNQAKIPRDIAIYYHIEGL